MWFIHLNVICHPLRLTSLKLVCAALIMMVTRFQSSFWGSIHLHVNNSPWVRHPRLLDLGVLTLSWRRRWEWTPDAKMAASMVSIYCCTRLTPEPKQPSKAGSPTLSITFWKAAGEWQVILHRAWKNDRRARKHNISQCHPAEYHQKQKSKLSLYREVYSRTEWYTMSQGTAVLNRFKQVITTCSI